MKMNENIKDDWITSLTNNEYIQGVGELRAKRDEYCCLGVLADRAVKAGIAQWEWQVSVGWVVVPTDPELRKIPGANEGAAILPDFIRDWAGLDACNPRVLYDGANVALSAANDSKQLDFATIAELIRECL